MKTHIHPISPFLRALRVAFLPLLLLAAAATAARAQLINETFTSSAANFTTSGGTWSVSSGKYVLTNPVTGGTGLNNQSVHATTLTGDWTLTADASTTATSSLWNDFAVIFGYQNSTNYYFFSSNESNDAGTSGILKVSGGVVTQLADITTAITAGTTYAVKIEKTGSTYKVYRNNVLLATATDSTWSSGKVGFGTLSDGATFDNLVVTAATSGTVAAPSFSPGGGTYATAQNVTISTVTTGASIRYTTNGTTPSSTTGTLYSGPVSISATTTLKAVAYKTGMTDSTVTSATYTITTPAKPGPTNTGWSGTLTPSGGMTITVAGTVVQNLDITGTVHVKANNVTIRNCRISGGIYSINCNYGFTGLLVEDCELLNMSSAGIFGGNFTARRLNIHDSDGDALKPTTNCLVEYSWFHHLGKADGAHADGVQSRHGGSNMTFRWNNFDMPVTAPAPYKSNAAFMLEPDGGQLTNVLIENNWLNGGNYTVYGSNMAGVTVRNNWFGRDYRYGIRNGVVNWSGNVWEDNGQPAP